MYVISVSYPDCSLYLLLFSSLYPLLHPLSNFSKLLRVDFIPFRIYVRHIYYIYYLYSELFYTPSYDRIIRSVYSINPPPITYHPRNPVIVTLYTRILCFFSVCNDCFSVSPISGRFWTEEKEKRSKTLRHAK